MADNDQHALGRQGDLFGAPSSAPARPAPPRPFLPRPPAVPAPRPAAVQPRTAAPAVRLPSPPPLPRPPSRLPTTLAALQPRRPAEEPPPAPDAFPVPDAPPKPKTGETEEIKGRIKKEIFAKDGFKVFLMAVKNGETISVTTSVSTAVNAGDKVVAKGTWVTYRGKPSFRALMLVHELPKDTRGAVTWLKTRRFPGVGDKTIEKLAKHFGDKLLEVIRDDSKRLTEAGLDPKKAEFIGKSYHTDAVQPEMIAFLGSLGLGEITMSKILDRYGASARSKIETNPWELADTIDGIGFGTADELARRYGHDLRSPERIRAALRFALREAVAQNGHCGLPPGELVEKTARLIGVHPDLVSAQLEEAIDGQGAVEDPVSGLIMPRGIKVAEDGTARHLLKLLDSAGLPEEEAESAVDAAQSTLGIRLDPSQRAAAVMALSNGVCIITGGPGTGKSTTQKVIVHALKAAKKEVQLAAPTGRAAKRLAEVSGLDASTCHRLLEWSAEIGGFAFNDGRPFPEDWFIIDEFSMVDIRLANDFIQAIKQGAGLTIVGDVDQLPSVGPGQVLRDLISAGAIPTAKLSTVHRQGKDSGIVTAAHRINSGHHPMPDPAERLNGFEILAADDPEAVVNAVVRLVRDELPARGFDPRNDVQVLAAMRKGEVGVKRLNDAIKAALNPVLDDGNSVEIKGRAFTVGDRVMHVRNDYQKGVYNGEVGSVCQTGSRPGKDGKEEGWFKVDYSGYEATYSAKDVEDVEQSWAATVHKSQGCEFPVVVLACPGAHAFMLTRNLVYTGVTRAKGTCIVVGEGAAVELAARTVDSSLRHTGLSRKLPKREPEAERSLPSPGFGPRFIQIDAE